MRKIIFLSALIPLLLFSSNCYAFGVGFGFSGAADDLIKRGQAEGKIPKIPGGGPTGPGTGIIWQKSWNSGGDDCGNGIAVDSSGNVYVTGYSTSAYSATYDYVTIKYNSSGDAVWRRIWDGGNDDYGYGIAVDDTGNVYVTGYCTGPVFPTGDCLTIKYNSIGDTVWQKLWDSGGPDYSSGIAVDSSDNVYVIGHSYNGVDSGFLIIKYNGTNGDTVWSNIYNSGKGLAIAVDSSGNVYVTGASSNDTNTDYLTIKCNSSGDTVWQKRYDGGNDEEAGGIAVDDTGNVYVTGVSDDGTNYDYLTIKYNSNGDTVWQKAYNSGDWDVGRGIAVDSSGSVYVTGASFNGVNSDYLTIKWNSNGDTVWQKRYDSGNDDEASDIAVDSSGYVYVIGDSSNGADLDFLTIKYRQH